MDVFARRALERPDVEAYRAGCNPRQHGSRLAHGARWSQDYHDAIAFGSGGSVTELSVTGSCRGGGDGNQHGTFAIPPLVKIAHFPKVNDSQCTLMTRLSLKDLGERRANPLANEAVVRFESAAWNNSSS
jgi:hypothetical protein